MCGIAGRVNFRTGAPVDRGLVSAMCDLMRHRGPDGDGVWCDGSVGFGHLRLAIIDLTPAGAQPMWSADGRLVITFNGEIYNFQELRARLEAKGHAFRSHTDTEVILAAYAEYGDRCVEHLVGMFAFAIWDLPKRRAVIARDRLGKKPLFFRHDKDGLAFASEVRAFFAEPSFEGRVDRQAIADYLSYQYVPAPGSAFQGVEKLPAAHILTIEDGRCETAPLLGPSLHAEVDAVRRRGRRGGRGGTRPGREGPSRERRAARGVPQRRRRLRHHRGADGAPRVWSRPDVLDRLHRREVQRAAGCATRRAAVRDHPRGVHRGARRRGADARSWSGTTGSRTPTRRHCPRSCSRR